MLRSIEDLLGVTTGGSDSQGHLGYAGAADLKPFGADVFAASCTAAVKAPPRQPQPTKPPPTPLPTTGGLPLALVALTVIGAALATRRLLRKAG